MEQITYTSIKRSFSYSLLDWGSYLSVSGSSSMPHTGRIFKHEFCSSSELLYIMWNNYLDFLVFSRKLNQRHLDVYGKRDIWSFLHANSLVLNIWTSSSNISNSSFDISPVQWADAPSNWNQNVRCSVNLIFKEI